MKIYWDHLGGFVDSAWRFSPGKAWCEMANSGALANRAHVASMRLLEDLQGITKVCWGREGHVDGYLP